jgi:hypothetical protein
VIIYAGTDTGAQGEAPREFADAAWVVDLASPQNVRRHPANHSGTSHHGAARLSPDNRRLYLAQCDWAKARNTIQCLDLSTGAELWQTDPQADHGLTALALSPDGKRLASASGFEGPAVRIWDAATGKPLARLDGHTAWVCDLAFSGDGGQLLSAASDQTIRVWDTRAWTEDRVLRGHGDEVHAVAIADPAGLIASTGKDGALMLWQRQTTTAASGSRRLPETLQVGQVHALDESRVLLLPDGGAPQLLDLKRDLPPTPLPGIAASSDILGVFRGNVVCHWDGSNQIVVRELRSSDFVPRGAVTVESGRRPARVAFNASRQLLAWTESPSAKSIYVSALSAPMRRIEIRSDLPGLPCSFSDDGTYLMAAIPGQDTSYPLTSLRVWAVETGKNVLAFGDPVFSPIFIPGGRAMAAVTTRESSHEVLFYDLANPASAPRRIPGKELAWHLAASPDGSLLASSTFGGKIRLFDPVQPEAPETLDAHLNGAFALAFSADGRRLISTSTGRESMKIWNVHTRQELLTLGEAGSMAGNETSWSSDGNVILAGAPWHAWRAPSWEEIAAAEAKEKAETQRP